MNKYVYIGENIELDGWNVKMIMEKNSIQTITLSNSYVSRIVRFKSLSEKHPRRLVEHDADLFYVNSEEAKLYYNNTLGTISSSTKLYDGIELRVIIFNANNSGDNYSYQTKDENWIKNNFILLSEHRELLIDEILN